MSLTDPDKEWIEARLDAVVTRVTDNFNGTLAETETRLRTHVTDTETKLLTDEPGRAEKAG